MSKRILAEDLKNTLGEKAITLCKKINLLNPTIEHICLTRNDKYRVSVAIGDEDDVDVMDMYFDNQLLLTKVVGNSKDDKVLDDLIELWDPVSIND